MSGSKHFDKIAWTVTALILIVTILFMDGNNLGLEAMEHTTGYENRLFDNTRVHTIDIVMDDWDELIDNATSEEYYTAAVVIDGESYKNVGIRAKGNTSLSTVASMDSERYSFKIEFDQYDNSITYHGLDKLSLNNLIQDSTMMKDYLTYTMMNEFGVAAPLCSYVYITVNGEDWGLYLAVEGVEESFLERNYGYDYGELYKPDSLNFGGGRGNGKDFDMDEVKTNEYPTDDSSQFQSGMPDMGNFDPSKIFGNGMPGSLPLQKEGAETIGDLGSDSFQPPEDFDPSEMFGDGGFGFGSSSEVKLQYIDDDLGSYSNIWESAKTKIAKSDQKRLVESLKKLSNWEDIESVVDIEQVLRYFVVHNYVCNDDSYTGIMVHNYYLYEENGQLAMIPWDYNLAFGTFTASDASGTVNTPIDRPVSNGSGEDRPMWSWILSDESYTNLYHQYFSEFLSAVDIQGIIGNTYNLIQSYVEKDPTAFYTYEEFETGVDTLQKFCSLRSQSISTQLETGETAEKMEYADASSIILTDMGAMNGGMGKEGNEKHQMPGMPQNGETPAISGGTDTAQIQAAPDVAIPEASRDGSPAQSFNEAETKSSEDSGSADGAANNNRPSSDNAQRSSGNFNPNMNGTGNTAQGRTSWIWLAVSVVVLGAGLLITKLYKH
ncbi:MAG: CotH kinase family protein [Clostridiales bacterium]|nr:CotH kinase family protein [Clostridiales bacterium]